MAYPLFGIGLFVFGLILATYGASMELAIVEDAMSPETNNVEYLKKIQSSGYAFSIGMMGLGGAFMIGGAFSIAKYRKTNN